MRVDSLSYTTVATSAQYGSLVQSLSVTQGLTLAADYLTNYPAFVAMAQQLINQDVQAIERNEPEGQRNYLVINGWGGQATHAANAVNSQWQQGKVVGTDGQPVEAWPEYPGAIAWASNGGDTLELRWLKEEWQLYLLVFVLIAVVGYLVYRVLTASSWQLQTASPGPQGSANTPPLFGGVPFMGGSPFRFFWLPWYWDLGIVAVAIGGPYLYRQLVSVDESRAKKVEADNEYRKALAEEE